MKATIGERTFALVKSPISRDTEKNCLPKRAITLAIVLNGAPFVASVTSNRSWSGSPSKTLEYIWIQVEGVAYYLTLDYAEKATDHKGAEIVTSEGVGPKASPRVAVGERKKIEEQRVAKFRAWADAN